jgi:ribonucleoside-diphosphate reductase alpha chain
MFLDLWKKVELSNAGEPGFLFTNDLELGTNPCAEISLNSFQFCNLVEINTSDIIDQFDFEQRAETAAFIGTLQASYTDFHYLRPEWKEVTEREALLGVGMTGIASGKILNLDIAEAAEAAVRVNKFVAATIGINEAARVTTVKPSGTASIVLGCSSGVHTWHSKYYIRRMRVGKSEALYTYMLINHPELLEDSVYDSKEAYVSVPIAAPAGALTRDSESAIDFLERVKFLHEKWIKPGHVYGENTHNISATVTMNPGEWKMVGEWLWENQNHYNGLSFLPEDLGSYQQTPFEEIDEARYLELSKNLKGLNVANIIEINDNTNLSGELACGGNGCEIV